MKIIKFTLFSVFCFFVFTLNVNAQENDSIIKIQLHKTIGQNRNATFHLNPLTEIKDGSHYKFQTGDSIESYVIGKIQIDKKFLNIFRKKESGTKLPKFENPNDIVAYVAITKDKKKIIQIDTDNDSSFLDEKKYISDISGGMLGAKDALNFINLETQIRYTSDSTIKKEDSLPIAILTNYRDKSDMIGGNELLQIYISPEFYWHGNFLFDGDTIQLYINSVNFYSFYNEKNTKIVIDYRNRYDDINFSCFLNKKFFINNSRFEFSRFDFYNGDVYLKRCKGDSIGNQPDNYLAYSPGININNYTLLFFTGSWCKPCKEVLKELFVFHGAMANVDIININHEKDSMEFVNYVNQYKIPWRVILDKTTHNWESFYKDTYEIDGYPNLFLVNPQRKIIRRANNKYECFDLLNELKLKGPKAMDKISKY